jgi:RNA polymerase sigma-70 factor (ECF subfamily)
MLPMALPGAAEQLPASPVNDERELIGRVLNGESEAFGLLTQRYHRSVFQAAMCHLNNVADAEECTQEAMLKAFAHLRSFRGECKFSTWLVQIAINEARMRLRKHRASLYESLDAPVTVADGSEHLPEVLDDAPGPSHELERSMLAQALARALSVLKPKYRAVFELRDIEHLSIIETAKILGISEAAVKTRLLRARLQLKRLLEPTWGKYWWQCYGQEPQRKVM